MPEISQYLVDCCTSNGLLVYLMTIFQAAKAENALTMLQPPKAIKDTLFFSGSSKRECINSSSRAFTLDAQVNKWATICN